VKIAGFSLPPSLQAAASLLLLLWLAGCATQRVDWAARVGHYTFEQAVADMGAPEKQDKQADGVMVAEWLLDRGYTVTEGGPGSKGPFYPSYPKTYTAPSRYLQLTFGTNDQLAAWKNIYK
jgi:hypothetical protein